MGNLLHLNSRNISFSTILSDVANFKHLWSWNQEIALKRRSFDTLCQVSIAQHQDHRDAPSLSPSATPYPKPGEHSSTNMVDLLCNCRGQSKIEHAILYCMDLSGLQAAVFDAGGPTGMHPAPMHIHGAFARADSLHWANNSAETRCKYSSGTLLREPPFGTCLNIGSRAQRLNRALFTKSTGARLQFCSDRGQVKKSHRDNLQKVIRLSELFFFVLFCLYVVSVEILNNSKFSRARAS